MKLTDNLVNKLGADKLLHFSIAGWAVSMASIYGYKAILAVTVIMIILSVVKELLLDKNGDWKDAIWAMYGCGIALANWVLAMELKYGQHILTAGLKYCCNWR